jgi:hypothetical protein
MMKFFQNNHSSRSPRKAETPARTFNKRWMPDIQPAWYKPKNGMPKTAGPSVVEKTQKPKGRMCGKTNFV